MRTAVVAALALFILSGACGAELPRVTLVARNQSADEVIASLQEQVPTVQLAPTAAVKANLDLDLQEVTLDEAVAAIAKGLKGSYLRGYLIEKIGPGDQPYTAEELIDYVTAARQDWQARLTPEQRRQWQDRLAATARERLRPENPDLTIQERADRMFALDDPLFRLTQVPFSEKITITVPEAPVQQAIDAVMLQSGYTVLLEDRLDGVCALQEQAQEVGSVVDKLAATLQATAPMFYIISQPAPLTPDEAARREERAFTGMWQQFWGMPKAERAQAIERALKTIDSVPPERLSEIKNLPISSRMFARFLESQGQLSMEQRAEIRPLVQAISRIMKQ